MVDRITFLESVNDIDYPKMLISFFDHFIALKQIVEETAADIEVIDAVDNSYIKFSCEFNDTNLKNQAINIVNSNGSAIIIYGRPLCIDIEELSETKISIQIR